MVIEKTNSEYIIKVPINFDTKSLQYVLDYLEYNEYVANSDATQNEVDKLAKEAKSGWWMANKDRFLK
mgnify:CR=1 FL=1